MTKNLVIGASGLVGSHLMDKLQKREESTLGTFNNTALPGLIKLDIRNHWDVQSTIKNIQPEVIYLCGADTNVDWCENNPEQSFRSNVMGVINVAQAAISNKANKIIFFSSDYVYDGINGMKFEKAKINPINKYGIHKAYAEYFLRNNSIGVHKVIIRTSWVFGTELQGKNFIYTLINKVSNGQKIRVAKDQFSTPTYAPYLINKAIYIANKYNTYWHGNIVHACCPEYVSKYEFAVEAVKLAGLDSSLVIPVTTSELKQVAKRPLNSGLQTTRLRELKNAAMPSYKDGLRDMFAKWKI